MQFRNSDAIATALGFLNCVDAWTHDLAIIINLDWKTEKKREWLYFIHVHVFLYNSPPKFENWIKEQKKKRESGYS